MVNKAWMSKQFPILTSAQIDVKANTRSVKYGDFGERGTRWIAERLHIEHPNATVCNDAEFTEGSRAGEGDAGAAIGMGRERPGPGRNAIADILQN
jgi:hypothetical protein